MPVDVSSQDLALEPFDSAGHPMAPWFAQFRSGRRSHYASRPGPRRRRRRSRAVITIVHDEPVFLPIWLRYYSRFFAPEDTYVLDNGSTRSTVAGGRFVRIPAAHDTVDHTWMVRALENLQHRLIARYDVVLVTDVDEIVAPNPASGNLGQYLDRFDEEWVNCLGYEVLHMKDHEPPLRLDEPILAQRGHWFFNDAYDKAALATVPMHWRPGLHGRSDFHYNLDPDLRMIHLHRMDYDICLARHRARSRRRWAEQDRLKGWAVHNRIVDAAEFARWFYEDSGFENLQIKPERIPDPWRGVL
jgi:hypothetical protein